MKKLTILFGLSILLFFASCKDRSVSKEVKTLPQNEVQIESTGKEIQILPPQEFHDATAGNNVQLLDVRTAEEFKEGHLDHAVNIDVLKDDFSEKAKTLDKDQPLYLYCRSGNRSAKASTILKDMGFKEIYDMEGGYLKWESENMQAQN